MNFIPEPLIQRPCHVTQQLRISRATLYRLIRRGEFPAPMRLSPGAVGWRTADVTAFVETRAQPTTIKQRGSALQVGLGVQPPGAVRR